MEPGAFKGPFESVEGFRLPPFPPLPLFGLARCSHLQPCVEQLPVRQKEKHTPDGASSPSPRPLLLARGVAFLYWAPLPSFFPVLPDQLYAS